MKRWNLEEARKTYNIDRWGGGYFDINEAGHVVVYPSKRRDASIDLKELVTSLERRGLGLPLLIRFSDILRKRVEELNEAFRKAIKTFGYQGQYKGVYPIKVNQQRQVVEEILSYGHDYAYGLEAGSKPELLAVIAISENEDSLIVCNGYKDAAYIKTALLASRLGKQVIIVVEKFSELKVIERVSKELGIIPMIGLRVRLSSRGTGRWESSGGDRAKFGLGAHELLNAVRFLENEDMLGSLQMLHFHLGSQISDIRSIKNALREAGRMFTELRSLGANLRFLNVGGGLGVDYDGSQTTFHSSINYSLQEYADDVVSAIGDACDDAEQEHPTLVSESGRAVTAHHSVLVFNILGVSELGDLTVKKPPEEGTHHIVTDLFEVFENVTKKNFQEAYHDALALKDECLQSFNLGYMTLGDRAQAEEIFWAIAKKILTLTRRAKYVPDEFDDLEKNLADTYFCNISIFQSLPDSWAVEQVFPIMPIHRLLEEPLRRGTLGDITCDSDGKLDHFIDLRDLKNVLELHPFNGEQYLLAVFLVGAYQEILGDLHNLFGDTNAVHVALGDDAGEYTVEHVLYGDTVREVLKYVGFGQQQLINRMRRHVEGAVRRGTITLEESAELLQAYEEGMRSYTYLTN